MNKTNPTSFSPLVGFFVFVYNHVFEKPLYFLKNGWVTIGLCERKHQTESKWWHQYLSTESSRTKLT